MGPILGAPSHGGVHLDWGDSVICLGVGDDGPTECCLAIGLKKAG